MTLAECNQYKTPSDLAPEIAYHEQSAEFHERQAKRHRERVTELEQAAADLGNGTLSEKQIARYPVIDKNPRPSTSTAGSVLSYDPHRILSTAGGGQ